MVLHLGVLEQLLLVAIVFNLYTVYLTDLLKGPVEAKHSLYKVL